MTVNTIIRQFVDESIVRYKHDIDRVVQKDGTPCQIKFPQGSESYCMVKLPTTRGRFVRLHKVIAYMKFGHKAFEKGIHIHHIDHNPENNKWENIQLKDASKHHRDDSRLSMPYKVFNPDHEHIASVRDLKLAIDLAKQHKGLYAIEMRGRKGKNSPKRRIDLSDYYEGD